MNGLFRCWWCDRVTKDPSLLCLARPTGYLKCRECVAYDKEMGNG